jgi:hypothetical protein
MHIEQWGCFKWNRREERAKLDGRTRREHFLFPRADTISACWGSSSKRKVAMAALDELDGNITQTLPATVPISLSSMGLVLLLSAD